MMKATKICFAAFALLTPSGAARAGDAELTKPAATPEQMRCQALGEGFFAVKGSTNCVRISGYISAGVGFSAPGKFAGPISGPFAPRNRTFSYSQGVVGVETRFDTALGPGRLYVQVGEDNWNR